MNVNLTIPYDICASVITDVERLLSMATRNGATPNDFPGAKYLAGTLNVALSSQAHGPTSSTSLLPRRRNKELAFKAKASAKAAKFKAARNDSRRKLGAWRRLPSLEIEEAGSPIASNGESSDSDTPLSVRHPSVALSSLSSLTRLSTPTPPPTSPVTHGRWVISSIPRPPPKDATRIIVKLALLDSEHWAPRLEVLLLKLESTSREPDVEPTNLGELAALCESGQENAAWQSYCHMRRLLQFTLWVEHYMREHGVTVKEIAEQFNIPIKLMYRYHGGGTRLAFLALCGTPYLFVAVALFTQRNNICEKMPVDDISSLGVHLRCLPNTIEGRVLRRRLLPVMQRLRMAHRSSNFSVQLPDQRVLDFWDIDNCDAELRKVDYKTFGPEARSQFWYQPPPISVDLHRGPEYYLPRGTIRATVAIILGNQPCPVNPRNVKSWTEEQRALADKAEVMGSLEEFLAALGEEGRTRYIYWDATLQEDEALHLVDLTGETILFCATHMPATIPETWDDTPDLLSIIFKGEMFHDHSRRPDYKFAAFHLHFYNRYSMLGRGAPNWVHPDFIKRIGVKKGNYGQRIPHVSEDIKEDTDRYKTVSDTLQKVMTFWTANLKVALPETYKKIEAYCDKLCLNDSPVSRPFTGVVINFCVSTDAHRDKTDDSLCLVIPFGEWEEGEIVFHELRLVVKLKSGHGVVYPSHRITHFNRHFSGVRGSIVLHTDGQGSNWVDNYNGWGPHILSTN